jgi:hypothetical protein
MRQWRTRQRRPRAVAAGEIRQEVSGLRRGRPRAGLDRSRPTAAAASASRCAAACARRPRFIGFLVAAPACACSCGGLGSSTTWLSGGPLPDGSYSRIRLLPWISGRGGAANIGPSARNFHPRTRRRCALEWPAQHSPALATARTQD